MRGTLQSLKNERASLPKTPSNCQNASILPWSAPTAPMLQVPQLPPVRRAPSLDTLTPRTPRTEPATPAIDAPRAEPSLSPSLSEAASLAMSILDVCKQLVDQPMMHAQAAHDTCAAVSSSLASVSGGDNLCMRDAE